MTWRSERTLWNMKGWSTLTYSVEMDPWHMDHPLEKTEVTWLRHAFGVGHNTSGWALYWLCGLLPATFRCWIRGLDFYHTLWTKPESSWEKLQMKNQWLMFRTLTNSGGKVKLLSQKQDGS